MIPGKKYTQTVEESFHVSQAVLDVNSVENGSNPVQVILNYDGSDFILTTLSKAAKIYQTPLDLNFRQGDKVSFRTNGPGQVHLSGYHVPDDDDLESRLMNVYDSDVEEEEDEETETETPSPPPGKRKSRTSDPVAAANKKSKMDSTVDVDDDEDDDDDDDDQDEDEYAGGDNPLAVTDEELNDPSYDIQGGETPDPRDSDEDSKDSDEDDENDDDDEEDDDEEEENTPAPQSAKKVNGNGTPSKRNKLAKTEKQKTPVSAQQKAAKSPKTPKDGVKSQKDGKTPKQAGNKTPSKTPNTTASQTPKKTVLEGGVISEDIKSGDGPVAKIGKMLKVYYTGRLKSNNKVFDQTTSGPGFGFKLGRGEVIKGWDIGVAGMKVGGKRKITIPAGLAYGAKGSLPEIPPHSTLIFDVELRGVS